jgi:hypothetical protein
MAFDYDKDNPTDGSYIADFPTNERLHRTNVLGSLEIDHDTASGEHAKVTLQVLGADPSLSGTSGFVYTKIEDGQTELFWLDDQGADNVQLTDKGSASPDKVAIDGDTMTGVLVIEAAASAIHLENLGAKIMGRDVGDAQWRALLSVDASDVCELGDESLDGGTRLVSDGEDALVAKYPGETDKKIWHAGHFAAAPLATVMYESTGVNINFGGAGAKYTVAHNLGFRPTLWMAVLQCTTNDSPYAFGEEVPLLSTFVSGSDTASDICCTVDGTNFYYRLSGLKPNMLGDTGNGANIGDDDWDIIFRAWYTE